MEVSDPGEIGHIYCVTECGPPMKKSVCSECKVEIGAVHVQVGHHTVTTEMYGAHRRYDKLLNIYKYPVSLRCQYYNKYLKVKL